jgi:hypothetical protein
MKTKLFLGMLFFASCTWSQSREIGIPPGKLSGYIQQNPSNFKLPLGNNLEDEVFTLVQTHVLPPELEAKYPSIRTFKGFSKTNAQKSITLTLTDHNMRAVVIDHGMILRLEPLTNELYRYYQEEPFSEDACEFSSQHKESGDHGSEIVENGIDQAKALWPSTGHGTIHYNIEKVLIPMTGNFAIDQNITTIVDGLAFVTNFMAAITAKYEMEIGFSLQLHPDNDQMIFLSAADPYPDYPTAVDSNFGGANSFLNCNQVICDSMIGNANYNLSIALCRTGTARGTYTAPCSVNYKGKVTSFNSIAAINHEIGHTFTCPHTSALTPSTGFSPYIGYLEPSTMGGGGQFFACTSIETLAEWAIAGNHLACATQSPSGNAAPQITATVDGKYMPANTPFVLANTNSTDADNDPLYYSWQSTDGYRAQYPDSSFSSPTEYLIFAPERPNLSGNVRYVPYLSNLVSGIDDPYSHLPWVTRDIHVRCLVRDSVGGVNMTFETVHVDGNSGPFKVNTPIAGDVVTELQTITVNWDIAGTTVAPVSAANVEILLSTDGGVTFPVSLTASTPNDGSQAVTIPNGTATGAARIMVKGNGIFFNINPADFTIYDNALPADFAVYSYDTLQRACSSSTTYEFIAQSLGGYTDPVTFSVSNLPSGVTSNFPQTINPGQHVNLVLSTISPSIHGTYHMTLTATSTSGTKTEELDLIVAGQIQTTNNYAMSAISTTDGKRYSIPDLTWNPSEYSVEYWVKFDPAAMGVNSSTIYWGASGNQLIRKNSNDHFYMQVCDGPHINLISSIDPVVSNRWYHVVGTYKSRKVNLYVDGIHQGQGNYGIIDALPWTSVSVGYQTNQGLSGQFDEVRIWNKCLTLDEVRNGMHLNLNADEVCSGNVELYLQFEQDSSTVYDVTGNHTVVPVNGPSSVLSDCPTASGVSVRKTVTATGLQSFDNGSSDTDLDITFNANPNGEVVAYKLLSIPNGTQPSFMDLNENAFWIVRNFGDTTLSYNATLAFTDPAFNLSPTAANYSIKQRQSFKATGAWGSSTIGSSYASNQVGFSGFNQFGHFAYGLDDDLNTKEFEKDGWLLYPNPAQSAVSIVFKDNSDKKIRVENALGELILSASIHDALYSFNLNQVSSGVYYVKVLENGNQSVKKLIVNPIK